MQQRALAACVAAVAAPACSMGAPYCLAAVPARSPGCSQDMQIATDNYTAAQWPVHPWPGARGVSAPGGSSFNPLGGSLLSTRLGMSHLTKQHMPRYASAVAVVSVPRMPLYSSLVQVRTLSSSSAEEAAPQAQGGSVSRHPPTKVHAALVGSHSTRARSRRSHADVWVDEALALLVLGLAAAAYAAWPRRKPDNPPAAGSGTEKTGPHNSSSRIREQGIAEQGKAGGEMHGRGEKKGGVSLQDPTQHPRWRVAVHEAGHALMALLVPSGREIHKATMGAWFAEGTGHVSWVSGHG